MRDVFLTRKAIKHGVYNLKDYLIVFDFFYNIQKINTMNRRDAITTAGLAAGSLLIPKNQKSMSDKLPKTPFKHSVCRWCFNDIPLETLASKVKAIGIESIELLTPNEWSTVYSAGLTCALATADFISLTEGFNNPRNHKLLQGLYPELMESAANQGIPQVICFSGNRYQISDQEGLENCATGLAPLVKKAENLGIMLTMELLNSKVNHPDYQCDHTPWGVKLVEKIGSPNFKLLYDIYHMQIMEGDVIATIGKHADAISHYHTAGVPGRHEIDESQELYYPAIMKAIADTGFTGYVAQEFIPRDRTSAFRSLADAIRRCSIS